LPEPSGDTSGSCVIGVYVFSKVTSVQILTKKEKITMKTRMKKLISIGTIPVLALALLFVLGTVLADDAVKPAPSLNCTLECEYVAHLGIFDTEGRLLVWDGPLYGDIEGRIRWWFVLGAGPPNMPGKQQVKFYEARWEILDDDENLLLAGNSSGTTATPGEKDGIWRGNGIVTEAYLGFEDWIGCRIYESGTVYWYPLSGDGIFRIN
jgi:hypothetical protein